MRLRILTLACLAALGASCHSNSLLPPSPTQPSDAFLPKLTSIKASGPTRFPPGGTQRFTATATLRDGTTQDYTNQVNWSTTDSNVLLIGRDGTAVPRSPGETTVSALLNPLSSSISVMVIPDGTYRLVGTVQEAGLPLSDATVTVIGGTGTGASARTDSFGRYKLYGVAGGVQVQVTKPGYDPTTSTISVLTDDVLDFPNMSETGGPPALAGTYSLSIVAANDCRSTNGTPLAFADRKRTYTAVLTENGPSVQVTLSGADFVVQGGKGNQFGGRASPGHVSFTLADSNTFDYYYYFYSVGNPDVIEQLAANILLSFWGTVDATASASGIAGVFSGNIVTYPNGSSKITESCASNHHQFVMTPLMSTRRKR
jgi:carboxypeptidase family protein